MGFGTQLAPFFGIPGPIITMYDELGQSILPAAAVSQNFPMSTMVYFQFVFAAITVILMAGAFLGRMSFTAWMIFVPCWITFSYTVGAFSLFGGGFLYQMGVIDYSGGYVIHLSSGTAGFVGAALIGPRLAKDRENFQPNNILLVLVGAGILCEFAVFLAVCLLTFRGRLEWIQRRRSLRCERGCRSCCP